VTGVQTCALPISDQVGALRFSALLRPRHTRCGAPATARDEMPMIFAFRLSPPSRLQSLRPQASLREQRHEPPIAVEAQPACRSSIKRTMKNIISAVVGGVLACSVSVVAQWPKYPASGIPRDAQGKVRMDAPPPRTADGK